MIGPSLYLTPLFGLPFVLVSARQRGWFRRLGYFTLLLSFAHIVANDLAWGYGVAQFPLEPSPSDYLSYLATGAIGGFAGSVLAFTLLIWTRLAPLTPATRAIMLFGIVALTALGAAGMAYGLVMTDALTIPFKPSRFVFWFLSVHLPWQAAFAFFAAWLMRLRPRA